MIPPHVITSNYFFVCFSCTMKNGLRLTKIVGHVPLAVVLIVDCPWTSNENHIVDVKKSPSRTIPEDWDQLGERVRAKSVTAFRS